MDTKEKIKSLILSWPDIAKPDELFHLYDDVWHFGPFFGTKELFLEFLSRWFRSYHRNSKTPRPKTVRRMTLNLVGKQIYDDVRNGTVKYNQSWT